MSVTRLLIVGLGSIGQRHLRLAREVLPEASIMVLRHRDCSFIPEYADACCSCLEEALAFKPQLAIIANPATHHMRVSLPLARAGVHLLVEKPLADSTTDAFQFIIESTAHGVIVTTGYNLRFSPSLQFFREKILGDFIGKVCSVRCEIGQYLPSWRPNSDYRNCVSARRDLGGGALLELSHEIDYVRWIFGEVEWVSATLSRQSELEIDVEDSAHLICGFASCAEKSALVGTLSLDFIRHDTTRQCTAIGVNGSLRWDGLSGVVEHYEKNATAWKPLFSQPPTRDESYRMELQHVLACIEEGRTPLISGEDGLRVLEIIEAARISAQTGYKTQVTAMGTTHAGGA